MSHKRRSRGTADGEAVTHALHRLSVCFQRDLRETQPPMKKVLVTER